MAAEFTLEEQAQLGDEEALHRRSDQRNGAVLRWYLRVFLVGGFIAVLKSLAESQGLLQGVLGAACLALPLVLVLLNRIGPEGRWSGRAPVFDPIAQLVARHPRPVLIGYLIAQYVAVVGFSMDESGMPWLVLFPFLTIPLRLVPAEFFLLHGSFAGAALIASLSGLVGTEPVNVVAPSMITNGFALAGALALNRRFRRNFLGEWHKTRRHALDQFRVRQELEFAREIQLSMLPRTGPGLAWIETSSVSLPANEVGGDYYDYFVLDDDRLAIVIGDVAGHGLASGLVLSGVRSGLTLLSEDLAEPKQVMERMHRMVGRTSGHRMMVTLAILVIDRATRRAMVTSAGHPPVLLRHGATGEVEEINLPALPLGVRIARDIPQRTIAIEAGDVFVLHTDGIYEARNAAGDSFGIERLMVPLAETENDDSAQSIRDRIIRDLWTFRGAVPQEDDVTLVVIRVGDMS